MEIRRPKNKRSFTQASKEADKNEELSNNLSKKLNRYMTKSNFVTKTNEKNTKIYVPGPVPSELLLNYINRKSPAKTQGVLLKKGAKSRKNFSCQSIKICLDSKQILEINNTCTKKIRFNV